ncbi:hypothetical protein [Actinomadura gamaensis]|uniref:Uncharacterized protein n=1 Tax=Actinomadura gamaensis TaxID=1763541 RepID=A0ABV9U9U5_9ACTN
MTQPRPPAVPPQPSPPGGSPARPPSPGASPARLAGAFACGLAVTTIAAYVVLFFVYVVSANTDHILVFYGFRVAEALALGMLMAVVFLIAKAKGPVAPIAAAIGGLIAERLAWLAGNASLDLGKQSLEVRFHANLDDSVLYTLLDWAAILAVPVVAGGLTAVFALRAPKPATAWAPAYPPPPPYAYPQNQLPPNQPVPPQAGPPQAGPPQAGPTVPPPQPQPGPAVPPPFPQPGPSVPPPFPDGQSGT